MTRALFVVDAGPNVGFGHFRRCSFLLREFEARGIECRVVVPPEASLVGLWEGSAGTWPDDLSQTDEADILIADSYRIGLETMRGWRRRHALRLVIDDNADRPLDADVVLNHNIYAPDLDYTSVCDGTVLAGLDYCLVDPRFADLRPQTKNNGRRVVVSFGGADTTRGVETARAILRRVPEARVDVIVPAMPDDAGEANDRLSLLVRPDMVAAMGRGTIYAGGAGVTTWEAAAAGLSIVVCRVADNQGHMIPALRRTGIQAFDAYDAEQMAAGVAAEAAKPAPGNPLAEVIDGRGAARAADVVLGLAQRQGISSRPEPHDAIPISKASQ
ncbi:MAG: hypothetical protein RIE87_01925 [Rhodospirillales bacterium]